MLKTATIFLLIISLLFCAPQVFSQEHVVSQSDLEQAILDSTQQRQENINKLEKILNQGPVQEVIANAGVDSQQIRTAIPQLSDEELNQITQRADRAHADFAAGAISTRDLLWIIVGILALILIIVAVD